MRESRKNETLNEIKSREWECGEIFRQKYDCVLRRRVSCDTGMTVIALILKERRKMILLLWHFQVASIGLPDL